MGVTVVRFNTGDKPEFMAELRKRVNQYFKDKQISKTGDRSMHIKTVFMLLLYVTPWVLIALNIFDSLLIRYILWGIVGLGMAGVGLSVMHDANHGSYSKNKKVNDRLGYLMNILGGNHLAWKIQHNVLHHSFTNIDGMDEDIDIPVMRFSPDQKKKFMFRFQVYYGVFFYGLLSLYKYLVKDFIQLKNYDKMGLLSKQGITLRSAIWKAIGTKILYTAIIIGVPYYTTQNLTSVIIGFLIMHFVCGLLLAFIFQSAHVVEEASFLKPDENHSVENSFAIMQMKTTSNFAHGSKWFSWLIGGLNYQVEHHLFPTICHVHYKNIAPIVKKTAEEFGVPYHQHKTFGGALMSHFRLLHALGK